MSRKRWYWLLVIPAVVPLLVPLYDRVDPTVYGFPFYYWGQLLVYPIVYAIYPRLWSVAHVHGLVTPADFVRARFGSRGLALLVAVTGIVATMPYIALQLIGVEAVLTTLGVPGKWPLAIAFAVLAIFTYHSGLRAPALIAFVKDILLGYVVLAVLLTVGMTWNAWGGVFHSAELKFHFIPTVVIGILEQEV